MNTESGNPAPAVNPPPAENPIPATDFPVEKAPEAALPTTDPEASKPAQPAEQKPAETNAVPKPQLGMPMFKRRVEASETTSSHSHHCMLSSPLSEI